MAVVNSAAFILLFFFFIQYKNGLLCGVLHTEVEKRNFSGTKHFDFLRVCLIQVTIFLGITLHKD
jgi:hypothetical protein